MKLSTFVAAAAVIGGFFVAPNPAEAFWGPNKQKVCEENLQYIESLRNELDAKVFSWSNKVRSVEKVSGANGTGFKHVTGCVTQFTHNQITYIQKANIEADGNQYYVSLSPAVRLH